MKKIKILEVGTPEYGNVKIMNKKELLKGGLDDIYRKYCFDLKERIDEATKEVKELYDMAKEQDSDNVNLIDRLENILELLKENND